MFWLHWGFFLEGQKGSSFLEILKLKNPYKITSSLSNAIRFLKKMQNNKIPKFMSIWVIIDTFKSDDAIRKLKNAILAFW